MTDVYEAEWIDGRTEQIDPVKWLDAVARGAVELWRVNDDGSRSEKKNLVTEAHLAGLGLRPGVRVRHKRHPELVGRIDHYEYRDRGKLSSLPFCVYWDDSDLAHRLLGMFFIYPSHKSLQPIEEASDG